MWPVSSCYIVTLHSVLYIKPPDNALAIIQMCEFDYLKKKGLWGTHHISLTNWRLHLKDFFFPKNPVEPWSLINYRKSTDDCCFLLAKSDFSVSLIPCHNLHPVYLSLASSPPSLSLFLCACMRVCVCLCVWMTVHPILSGQAFDWGRTSLPLLSENTKTDLDQRWLQAGAQMTEAEGGWEGPQESFVRCNNEHHVLNEKGTCAAFAPRTSSEQPCSVVARPGEPRSDLTACWDWKWMEISEAWKNGVVVDFTVWFLECLWRTAIHSREQRSYVGQLVSTFRNHLLSFAAFNCNPVSLTKWNHKYSQRSSCFSSHIILSLACEVKGHFAVSTLPSYSRLVKEGLHPRLVILIKDTMALCVCPL